MTKANEVLVDFVVHDESTKEWRLVLVEEGPWLTSEYDELKRIQDRLYGCLDAVLDGHLFEAHPETLGKNIVVQLDCYDLPRAEVEGFFERFSTGILLSHDYRSAIESKRYFGAITFAIDFGILHLP